MKIDFDGLGLLKKILIDNELKSIDLENLIRIYLLIQSHGQTGAASAAFVEEDPNGLDLFTFEIFGNLLNRRLRYLEHDTLLGNKKSARNKFAPQILSPLQPVSLTMSTGFVNLI